MNIAANKMTFSWQARLVELYKDKYKIRLRYVRSVHTGERMARRRPILTS
jgi:hypothetical protein